MLNIILRNNTTRMVLEGGNISKLPVGRLYPGALRCPGAPRYITLQKNHAPLYAFGTVYQ